MDSLEAPVETIVVKVCPLEAPAPGKPTRTKYNKKWLHIFYTHSHHVYIRNAKMTAMVVEDNGTIWVK